MASTRMNLAERVCGSTGVKMGATIVTTGNIQFGYAPSANGQVHYAWAGAGPAVLCLHQTPRSWDEFREVLPALSGEYRVIAMDTPGMGNSTPDAAGASIEGYAAAAIELLAHLKIEKVALVGHHTGGVIAVRVASLLGSQVVCSVFSSTPLIDAPTRERRLHRNAIDAVEECADGSHLQTLWDKRAAFYPANRPDLRRRYVVDALRAANPEEGHEAVARYHMEKDIERVTQPALVVCHAADPYAAPEAPQLQAALANSTLATIDSGMVPLEFAAAPFSALVLEFLRQQWR